MSAKSGSDRAPVPAGATYDASAARAGALAGPAEHVDGSDRRHDVSVPPVQTKQAPTMHMVQTLSRTFVEQVERALGVQLDDTPISLAFVDHYLSLARDEDREPIVSLLAAGAGAYFGELVRRTMGGTWVGDGDSPRRLRLLVEPQFVHFSPVDQAYEAIAGEGLRPNDPRIPPGPSFDSSFGLRPPAPDDEPGHDDATWLAERLAELSPVPEDEFHSLTCRFETLQLMLELLAAKHHGEGLPPRRLGVDDYVEVLSRRAAH